MTPRKPLKVVSDDDVAEVVKPASPKTIKAASESSERDLLVSLRSYLALQMDAGAVPAHALASVSSKIREYDREIRALDARAAEEAKNGSETAAEDGSFDANAV